MKKTNLKTLIISILIPLVTGFLSYFLSRSGMAYYETLNKPALNPPSILFPIVWTILYILMGISSYIVYTSDSPFRQKALKWYVIQLIFNFGWSIIFFGLSKLLFAYIWLLILIASIVVMIYYFYKVKPIAAYLQIPYLLWCIFAAYLNLSIYFLNPPTL